MAVLRARPDIVIHQLTDLPPGLDPTRMAEGAMRNARIRSEGTANLVAAARAAGSRRIVAQSIAWAYAPGATPFHEYDPLDLGAAGIRAISVSGVVALEHLVLGAAPVEGVVLRYGQLYGPGTGVDGPVGMTSPLHVDAAAQAALLAMVNGQLGIFNIAEDGAQVDTTRARKQLGWDAAFRLPS
jgi:nucleoside-diphosphate-sugar epimerase